MMVSLPVAGLMIIAIGLDCYPCKLILQMVEGRKDIRKEAANFRIISVVSMKVEGLGKFTCTLYPAICCLACVGTASSSVPIFALPWERSSLLHERLC